MSAQSEARERALNFRTVYEMAKHAGAKFPEVAAAQWAQETGHGTSSLATMHNNLFGQKGEGVSMQTHEYEGGVRKDMPDNFMRFDTPYKSTEFLVKNWYHDSDKWGDGLTKQGGGTREGLMDSLGKHYATDPNYSSHLQKQIDRYMPDGRFSPDAGESTWTPPQSTVQPPVTPMVQGNTQEQSVPTRSDISFTSGAMK